MAAVEHHDHFAGGDRAQGFGELGPGDGCRRYDLRRGNAEICLDVDRKQVLAGVGAGLDAPTVAGDIEEDDGVLVAAIG